MLSNRKIRLIWNSSKIVFSIALVVYFLTWVNLKDLYALQERMRLPDLIATVLLYSSLTFLKAYLYQQLLGEDRTKYLRVLNIIVLQNSISNFLANSAGLASYFALLRLEENVKVRQSGLTFLIIKIGGLFAVWVFSAVCSLLLWDRIAELHSVILFFLILVGLGFAVFFPAPACRRAAARWYNVPQFRAYGPCALKSGGLDFCPPPPVGISRLSLPGSGVV